LSKVANGIHGLKSFKNYGFDSWAIPTTGIKFGGMELKKSKGLIITYLDSSIFRM